MTALSALVAKRVAAAAALTGKRFALLVASSLVATSAIVAAGADRPAGSDLPAGRAARPQPRRQRSAGRRPAVEEPEEELETAGGSSPEPASGAEASFLRAAPGAGARTKREEEPAPEPEEGSRRPKNRSSRTGPDQARLRRLARQLRLPSRLRRGPARCPTWRHAAPAGQPADQLLAADGAARQRIATISGQPPNAATEPTARPSTTSRRPRDQQGRVRLRRRLRLPGRNALARRPARQRAASPGSAYMEGDGRPAHRRTGQLRLPRTRRRRSRRSPGGYSVAAQPVHPLPLAARPRRLRGQRRAADRAEKDLKRRRRRRRTSPTSPPTSATPASPASARKGRRRPPPRPTPGSPKLVPKILESPAYKKDGLLIVTFGEVNPPDPAAPPAPAPTRPAEDRRPAGLPASPPRARPTPPPTTPTRCCARARNSSGSTTWPAKPARPRSRSFAPPCWAKTAATDRPAAFWQRWFGHESR